MMFVFSTFKNCILKTNMDLENISGFGLVDLFVTL